MSEEAAPRNAAWLDYISKENVSKVENFNDRQMGIYHATRQGLETRGPDYFQDMPSHVM